MASVIPSLGKAALGGAVCGTGFSMLFNLQGDSPQTILLTTVTFVATRAIAWYVGTSAAIWGLSFAALAVTSEHDSFKPEILFGGFFIGASLGYLIKTIFQSNVYFLI